MKKRKICVFTGSRADYGHLIYLMKEIQNDSDLILQTIVSGMHLCPEFGLTWQQIELDGFCIDEKVEMLLSSDSPTGIIKSVGVALIGFADALKRLRPEIVVVLGDRFEALAIAQACLIARIPLAHIHGGEVSEGAIDESIRHAITKLSYLHFPCNDEYKKRIVQLGENPERCWNFGAPGIDHLNFCKFLSKRELEEFLSLKLGDETFLITYHPATAAKEDARKAFGEILKALAKQKKASFVFTYPNADTNGRVVIKMIEEFVENHPENSKAIANLGQRRYLSLLRFCKAMIGNSSSGLIEAPVMKVPTINIGERQKGRLKSKSVIDVKPDWKSIDEALNHLNSNEFQDILKDCDSMYGYGNTSPRIKEVLKNVNLDDFEKSSKRFFDIDF